MGFGPGTFYRINGVDEPTGPRKIQVAQWICPCLPSCGPGFESQAQHLYVVNFCAIFELIKRRIYGKNR